jgi:serine/threonine protein phosphatase PrpC
MLEGFGVSDPGCVRNNNEDYYLMSPSLGLYVVADGMGGAQAGECASQMAAETVGEVVYRAKHYDSELLSQAFEEANRRVLDAASKESHLEGMGTTLTAILDLGNEAHISSVGDSRVYIFQDGGLLCVTEDQTWVQEVGRRLGIEEAQLKTHQMRHVLTMAIGVSDQLRVHSYKVQLQPGMQFLVCSDGLHGVIGEDSIVEVLRGPESLELKGQKLIERARKAGGPDNITAILLHVVAPVKPLNGSAPVIQ